MRPLHRFAVAALLVFATILLSTPAAAQTDWHIYGGGAVGSGEHIRRGLVGFGVTSRPIYFGVDAHDLWQTGEEMELLADVALGGVVRSGRVDIIPIGIIGYTTAEVHEKVKANVGAGLVAAFKGESGRGLHVGFRYTRHYGAALSVGFVFQTN